MSTAAWAGDEVDLGNGTSRLGEEGNTTAWWTKFTDYVDIAPDKTLTYTFVNHSSKANLWNNWAVQICEKESNYEYLIMRADCFGVTAGDWTNKNTNIPGWFLVNFDIVGPVTMSNGYTYYGKDSEDGKRTDENVGAMICNAIAQASQYVNWKDYDWDGDGEVDLSKLKKKELLEIMLRQGEEIDTLRAQVADLQAQLDERIFKIYKAGSIAEASLQVTKIFEAP